VLDIDLGRALVFFLFAFVVLPVGLAAVAVGAIAWLVRNATRRLAVGVYVMLACALITPAPVVWGDDHLGFASSQALEGYGALLWIVGATTTVHSLAWLMNRRQATLLALGLTVAAIVLCAGVLASAGAAVGLALIPPLGTLGVLLALGCLKHRLAPVAAAPDWPLAAGAGATCACVMAAYVYLRGPQAFGPHASGMDLALLGVLACLPVLGLARMRTLRPRSAASHAAPDEQDG
jgi:hypothetical protein